MRLVETARCEHIRVLFLKQGLRDESLGASLGSEGEPAGIMQYSGYLTVAELHEKYREYQGIMLEVAAEMNVPVADAAKAFEQ